MTVQYDSINSSSNNSAGRAVQLRHANRRWVICLSKDVVSRDETGANLFTIAELFVKHQINLILICFDADIEEQNIAETFIEKIKDLSATLIVPL